MKIVFHPEFYRVYTADPAAEEGRMEAIISELKDYEIVEPEKAEKEDILLVHTERHYEWVRNETGVYDVAILAAGGAILASEIAFEEPAFAAVRPPGHHASPDSSWGFCYFNNIAIAVRKLTIREKIERAAVVDFDLHFGDGTANTFRDDERVSYFHMKGGDVNGIAEFLESAEYDIVAASAGFDRAKEDWGGILDREDYTEIGKILKEYPEDRCDGRRFAVLEGGYNHAVLGKNVRAFLRGFE
ncbi:histone deacetylase family protein [Geoglobus acetivorans]|uniref:Histone deacetylase family protein n=1 Tax=Geoglobus acetivorans TaxID=565033 RepID=A0ABZ3H374_GEOAI|nr:histone deacetylase family protein [Geoglobus acetivorans]